MNKSSFPQEIVSVPNVSHLDTISEAWDYAARVSLRMSQRTLTLGPSDPEQGNLMAEEVYKESRKLIPHSDEDIRRFESLHRSLIEKRLAEHPSNLNMVVSRPSLSLLYDAITCKVMAEIFDHPPSTPEEVKNQREVARAIYIHYNDLLIDERTKVTPLTWLKMIDDHYSFGPNAAAKRHADEIRGGSLSRRHVKAQTPKIFPRLLETIKCSIDYVDLVAKYEQRIKRDLDSSRAVLDLFGIHEFFIYGQRRKYQYAWVIHDKKSSSSRSSSGPSDYFKEGRKTSLYSKNSKSSWCPISPYESLSEVSVDDA